MRNFNLQSYFEQFRVSTVGYNQSFTTCMGVKELLYADWAASGRLYLPVEERLTNVFGPLVGNTHSESSTTGCAMTRAYKAARDIIKRHVNADEEDILICTGSGMTAAVNKLQRILSLRIPECMKQNNNNPENCRPVVILTHMEHHSNQISWLETASDVVCIEPQRNGLVDLDNLREIFKKYKDRKIKIGSFTACSNVTGIIPPYHKMARIMHENDGVCFVDFSASAPYVDINMHPADPMEKLDGIFFSPHKFLGGPGTPGILIFNSRLYPNLTPDCPGGGTVKWTNPWGEHRYYSHPEMREDGGTPGFMQTIKAALCIELKNKMGVHNIQNREKELLNILMPALSSIDRVHILHENIKDRLGIVSFHMENIHYNLLVKILNDYYGIQTRGGCSCAGTYGHYLFNINRDLSKKICDRIDMGDMSLKPGWVRISIHPIMTDKEVYTICSAVYEISRNIERLKKEYTFNPVTNEFTNIHEDEDYQYCNETWFKL